MSRLEGPPPGAGHWRLVLPIKGTPDAKSRLSVPEGIGRADLARAMALDTLQAALDCRQVDVVVVVTSDRLVTDAATAAGALVEPDQGSGLNDAVRRGVEVLTGGGDGPIAILLADLPALRPADLNAALLACSAHQVAYVPDAEGTGTVLLAAAAAPSLRPEFGEGSAGRHERGGAVRLEVDRPRLRRDVDVQSELQEALRLGVGPRTAAALASVDQRWLA